MRSGEAYGLLKGIVEQNFHRSMKYAFSGFVGFLFVEFTTYMLFHVASLSNLLAVTPAFLAGVAMEFSIDEFWTTRNQGMHTSGALGFFHRMLKFEILNIAGTILAVIIQYILFVLFSLSPLIGNIFGSAFEFPINYYIQMRSTWKIRVV